MSSVSSSLWGGALTQVSFLTRPMPPDCVPGLPTDNSEISSAVLQHLHRWFGHPGGVLFPPVVHRGIGSLGQPALIGAECLEVAQGKIFRTRLRRVAKWFEQAGGNQDGDVVFCESKIPG